MIYTHAHWAEEGEHRRAHGHARRVCMWKARSNGLANTHEEQESKSKRAKVSESERVRERVRVRESVCERQGLPLFLSLSTCIHILKATASAE